MTRDEIDRLIAAELALGLPVDCEPWVRGALSRSSNPPVVTAPAQTYKVAILYADARGYAVADKLAKHLWFFKPVITCDVSVTPAGRLPVAKLTLVLITADMAGWLVDNGDLFVPGKDRKFVAVLVDNVNTEGTVFAGRVSLPRYPHMYVTKSGSSLDEVLSTIAGEVRLLVQ